jgi:hypothetical protein
MTPNGTNILFPDSLTYDWENDTRTSSINKVIELISELSATYTQKKSDKLILMITSRLQ